MQYYDSSNPVPVDSPFAKILFGRDLYQAVGLPPSSNSDIKLYARDDYILAAKILGLDSPEAEFVARRVRHLAKLMRVSKYADRMTWRSGLAEVDLLAPIIDEPVGLLNVMGATSTFTYTWHRSGTPDPARLNWKVQVTGIGNGPLTFIVDGVPISQFTNFMSSTAIGGSGYFMGFNSSQVGSGTPVNFSASIVQPYSGDCIPIYDSIKANKDFIYRSTYGKEEYYTAIFDGDSVEDGIAAFILAIDEL